MSLSPLIGTLLFALALLMVSQTPQRAMGDVRPAIIAIFSSWALCAWSTSLDPTPAQIVMNLSGQAVDPYRFWAMQDAVCSAWLASHYILTRGRVTAIVGLIFAAQLFTHMLGASNIIADRQPVIDTLFVAQLIAVSTQGALSIGQHIGDWAGRHRRGGLVKRIWGLRRSAFQGLNGKRGLAHGDIRALDHIGGAGGR